jgi:fatty acid desaturase
MAREVKIENKLIRNLSKKNNLKAINFTLTRILFHILLSISIYFILQSNFLFLTILLLVLHFSSFSFMGLAGISHELLHNTVFSKKIYNQTFYKVFCILTYNNYSYFELTHWEHHKNPLSENDPKDLFKGKIDFFNLFLFLTFDFKTFFRRVRILFLNSIGIIPVKISKELFIKGSINQKKITQSARVILLYHIISSLMFIYFGVYEFIFLLTLAPFTITFFNKLLAISQHYGLPESSNDLISCRTILLNPFLSYFYANMNYHVEHHLYPGVPLYNLKKVHHLIAKEYDYPNLSKGIFGVIIDLKKKGLFSKN